LRIHENPPFEITMRGKTTLDVIFFALSVFLVEARGFPLGEGDNASEP